MNKSRNSETRGAIVGGGDGSAGARHGPFAARHSQGGTRRATKAPRAAHASTRRRGQDVPVSPTAPARQDQRPIDGLGPLWVFAAAALAVVGAVTLAGAVNSWWILLPAMAVFVISTIAVLATIMWLLGDDAGAP